jgi:hypothetical protein
MKTTKIAIAHPKTLDPSAGITRQINWLERSLRGRETTNPASPINEIRTTLRERKQRKEAPPIPFYSAVHFAAFASSNQVSQPLILQVARERRFR